MFVFMKILNILILCNKNKNTKCIYINQNCMFKQMFEKKVV